MQLLLHTNTDRFSCRQWHAESVRLAVFLSHQLLELLLPPLETRKIITFNLYRTAKMWKNRFWLAREQGGDIRVWEVEMRRWLVSTLGCLDPWRYFHPSIRLRDNLTRMVRPSNTSSHATIYYCDIQTQNGCIVCPSQNVDGLLHADVTTPATIHPSDNTSIRKFVHFGFQVISTVPGHFLACALT